MQISNGGLLVAGQREVVGELYSTIGTKLSRAIQKWKGSENEV